MRSFFICVAVMALCVFGLVVPAAAGDVYFAGLPKKSNHQFVIWVKFRGQGEQGYSFRPGQNGVHYVAGGGGGYVISVKQRFFRAITRLCANDVCKKVRNLKGTKGAKF